jgi:hypothetical protein
MGLFGVHSMHTLQAGLSMIPRELPDYLETAYSLRYADEPNEGSGLSRACRVAQRTLTLIKELVCYRPTGRNFLATREKLGRDFRIMADAASRSEKPLCVYFVSSSDHNGAIVGTPLYYYHHYKIRNLQKYFAVAPMVVSSQGEMKKFMVSVRRQHAGKEIAFVDIVSHGTKSSLEIHAPERPSITIERLRNDLFSDCASDATILLDACFTGEGSGNIAEEIARKTPGRMVLAPGTSMYFSKPEIQIREEGPRVISAVHGTTILNTCACRSFSYAQ